MASEAVQEHMANQIDFEHQGHMELHLPQVEFLKEVEDLDIWDQFVSVHRIFWLHW
jgi:hypothetical protein